MSTPFVRLTLAVDCLCSALAAVVEFCRPMSRDLKSSRSGEKHSEPAHGATSH